MQCILAQGGWGPIFNYSPTLSFGPTQKFLGPNFVGPIGLKSAEVNPRVFEPEDSEEETWYSAAIQIPLPLKASDFQLTDYGAFRLKRSSMRDPYGDRCKRVLDKK